MMEIDKEKFAKNDFEMLKIHQVQLLWKKH